MQLISAEDRARLAGRLVVASVSGGKDSTALALALREADVPHVRVFADTGFEAPETYAYLDQLRARLGPISVVRNEALWQDTAPGEEGLLTLARRKRMFPSRFMRFCTQQLKLHPIRDFLRTLQDEHGDVVSAVGVRAEESATRAAMPVWEFWDEIDAEVWRPLLAWTEQDVIDMHRRHGLPPNPLYLRGARRVGCFPCIHASKHDLRILPPEQLTRVRQVEADLTADATARGCERPTRALLQLRGPGGRRFAPIDEVVEAAHLHRGAPVLQAQTDPCARWGLCETAHETAPPDTPPSTQRRRIGRGHLEQIGVPVQQIETWITDGRLLPTGDEGFYERSEVLEPELGRLMARRRVGRGHLLELGATPALIARWLRRGTLRRTPDRGFYDITIAAFEGLRPSPVLEVAAPSAEPAARPEVDERPRPAPPASSADSSAAARPEVDERPRPAPPASSADSSAAENLRVVACTIRRAREYVALHHRHLGPPASGLFAVGVARGDALVGVAIVGRPVARALQDGRTAEVTRVCMQGERNACSMLLAACRRGARALGYHKAITYTMESEPGASPRCRLEGGRACPRTFVELSATATGIASRRRQAAVGGERDRAGGLERIDEGGRKMPDVRQEFAEELRRRIERLRQAIPKGALSFQDEMAQLKRARRWVVLVSGVVALGAGYGLGCALTPGRDPWR